ncbi:MAG: hypothetical protein MZV70_51490 [Desulfobacterales bacterium]|nr:hypothetical protein [Desulfobacterales bacterium]
MIGHTKAAAGAAGLVKAALAALPQGPAAHPQGGRARPRSGPRGVAVLPEHPLAARGSRPTDRPRRAAVSAFGFGGSNFHMVLEEHRPVKAGRAPGTARSRSWRFRPNDREDLLPSIDARQRVRLADPPSEMPRGRGPPLGRRSRFDAAPPLPAAAGRRRPGRRLAPSWRRRCRRRSDRACQQDVSQAARLPFSAARRDRGELGFPVPRPGQPVRRAWAAIWSACFPTAMAVLEDGRAPLASANPPLSDLIYPRPGADPDEAESALRATDAAQPAIGAVSLAMLRVLAGVRRRAGRRRRPQLRRADGALRRRLDRRRRLP